MAITRASDGIKSAGGTGAVTLTYDGVAAGRLALCGRCVWLGTASTFTESGFSLVTDLSGGTGTSADDHTTIIRVDERVLDGTESGDITPNQSSVSGAIGVMPVYAHGGGGWDTIASATGDDATHGTGRSVTASVSISFQPGDVLVAFVAVDTDSGTSWSAKTLAASGITFGGGTVTVHDSTSGGVLTGLDGNIMVLEATVTAGTGTVAPTLTLTGGPSQCGPVAFIRLREIPTATDLADDARHLSLLPGQGLATSRSGFAAATRSIGLLPGLASVRSGLGMPAEARSLSPLPGSASAAVSVGIGTAIRGVSPLLGTSAIQPALGAATATRFTTPLAGSPPAHVAFGLASAARHTTPLAGTATTDISLAGALADEVRHATAILGLSTAVSAIGLASATRSISLLPGPGVADQVWGLGFEVRFGGILLGSGVVRDASGLAAAIRALAPLGPSGSVSVALGIPFDGAVDARSFSPLWGGTAIDMIFGLPSSEPIPDTIIVNVGLAAIVTDLRYGMLRTPSQAPTLEADVSPKDL